MLAKHIMTKDVATIAPDGTVREAARLMTERRVSALAVTGADGRLLGIVSEGDLMFRAETGAERPRSWWLSIFSSSDGMAEDFVKSHARRIGDVMTRDVVTVDEETPIGEVARTLEARHIKRVPVLSGGRLAGIISRADIVRTLAAAPEPVGPGLKAGDEDLRLRVEAALRDQAWARSFPVGVSVNDGVVHLWGFADSEAKRTAIRVLVEEVPGVERVENHLKPSLPAYGGI
ncbi:MAG: CBS domain-containing protein [Alphaproteobacteria bacterium]